jgi:hypothetical protein
MGRGLLVSIDQATNAVDPVLEVRARLLDDRSWRVWIPSLVARSPDGGIIEMAECRVTDRFQVIPAARRIAAAWLHRDGDVRVRATFENTRPYKVTRDSDVTARVQAWGSWFDTPLAWFRLLRSEDDHAVAAVDIYSHAIEIGDRVWMARVKSITDAVEYCDARLEPLQELAERVEEARIVLHWQQRAQWSTREIIAEERLGSPRANYSWQRGTIYDVRVE